MNRYVLLGGPGAGKTERLLREVVAAFQAGARPDEVAFVSFSRAAARDARRRAIDAAGIPEEELVHFRTIHSMCYKALGLRRSEVFSPKHSAELSDLLGASFGVRSDLEGVPERDTLFVDQYSRACGVPLEEAWHDYGEERSWYDVLRTSQAYRHYKQQFGLLDFTDMLEKYANDGVPLDNIKLAIVDEAQDMTALQHLAVKRAFANAKVVWLAGDDDQAIHGWAGADPELLLNAQGERVILPLSHRLPRQIMSVAQSIIKQVTVRADKPYSASDRDGEVDWVPDPELVDMSEGSWLVLARAAYQLHPVLSEAHAAGVYYTWRGEPSVNPDLLKAIRAYEALRKGEEVTGDEAGTVAACMGETVLFDAAARVTARDMLFTGNMPIWHDAFLSVPEDEIEHTLACRRRGERLNQAPRVRFETIHGAKGLEADNVLLLTDVPARVARGMELDPDGEHRVFYVGATRARERLVVGLPHTPLYYPIENMG